MMELQIGSGDIVQVIAAPKQMQLTQAAKLKLHAHTFFLCRGAALRISFFLPAYRLREESAPYGRFFASLL